MNQLGFKKGKNMKFKDLTIDDFETETALGEPQHWIYLPDDTTIEITYEEYSPLREESFYSFRHHTSEKVFEDSTYRDDITLEVIRDTFDEMNKFIKKYLEKY